MASQKNADGSTTLVADGVDITTPESFQATPVPTTPPTINSTNTQPQTPIPYSTPNPVPPYPVASLDPSVPPPPPGPTPTENSLSNILKGLKTLNDSTVGKSAYQTAQEETAGVPEAQKAVTDLAAQLTGLQNEAKAIPLALQTEATGRGITAEGLAPIQSQRLRDNAIKALTVSTLLEAAKGNLSNAQSIADKAVKQKYDPIQEQITAAKNNLDLILKSPEYTDEEKAKAQTQLDIQNAKQAKLDKAKEDAKTISTVAITAAANTKTFKATTAYPSAATALQAITNAKTPQEATQIATETGLIEPKKVNTQIVEINGRKVLVDSDTGATIKDLGAASSGSSGTATEREAAKLQEYANAFVQGAKMPDGTPVVDTNGYLTPVAFKAAIADYGGDRATFLKKYGYLLYQPSLAAYGLTPAEQKLITGALPE